MGSVVSLKAHQPAAHPPALGNANAQARPAADPERRVELSSDLHLHAAIARLAGGFSPLGLTQAWLDWAMHLAVSPGRVTELGIKAATEAQRLALLSGEMLAKEGVCNPCEKSLPQDKRFRDASWQQWPFALYAEAFLSMERWWDQATSEVHGATAHHLAQINFVGRQAMDMIAPSNFIPTNPEVLRRTAETGGANLATGALRGYEDLRRGLAGEPSEGRQHFRPGKTVAISPGKVIARNEFAEVIQYSPTTATVRLEPILITPAWIMKYYILDLSPENSLVKHLVDEGFTVFMISWKNPGREDRDRGFDDYRAKGVMAAIDAALAITGAKQLHAIGYCIGGTLLAATAAAMARDDDDRLRSLTLLAAQTDFTEAGELQLFIDESQLAALDDIMAEQGAFQASQMAGTFNLLRSNDLIWSRNVRRYLMSEDEQITDIAAWASDATRLPYRMHSEYLRGLYLNNDLAEGRFLAAGRPIALPDIHVPIFAVGTEWDHVAPWRSVYKLHLLTDVEVTFVLTNGGHNQGVVSPPSRTDRHFRIATAKAGERHRDPESWLTEADYLLGSWWPAWFGWLQAQSGPLVAPPAIGRAESGFSALCDAPGTYVFD